MSNLIGQFQSLCNSFIAKKEDKYDNESGFSENRSTRLIHHEEPPPKEKLTKQLFVRGMKEGTLKPQGSQNTAAYDSYYELASLEMFY